MPHDSETQKYLSDMRNCAAFVVEILADRQRADLDTDRVLRSATERELSVVGEALYQLHRTAPEQAQKIDNWRAIVRFRHILVHGYSTIDMDMIWDVTQFDLKPLIEQIDSLLAKD